MSEKRRVGQQEAYLRSSDRLAHGVRDPKEHKMIGRAMSEVLYAARKGSGTVVFPEQLDPRQQHQLRQRLDRHHSGFATQRIEYIAPVRLEEGVGTEISIRRKR